MVMIKRAVFEKKDPVQWPNCLMQMEFFLKRQKQIKFLNFQFSLIIIRANYREAEGLIHASALMFKVAAI